MTGSSDGSEDVIPFDTTAALAVLRAACYHVGLPPGEATLLRLGENAIYHIASLGVVVRIARTMKYWEDARKEVAVAAWLSECGFPAVRIMDIPQPIVADGHPVTFWHYVDGRVGQRGDIRELGVLLRRLHVLDEPSDFALPQEYILGRVRSRVDMAPVPDVDKRFLLDRFVELDQELQDLRFPLAPGPTHGDAHIKNLMVQGGIPLLIDFERFSWGQPEWDLALTATEYRTAHWWNGREYNSFSGSYGYDVMSWAGFDVLRAVHEIKMTTWLMQNVAESDDIAEEYHARMRTIRNGEAKNAWRPF